MAFFKYVGQKSGAYKSSSDGVDATGSITPIAGETAPHQFVDYKLADGSTVRFPTGEAVEVTDEALVAKLKGHSHFEAVDEPVKESAPVEAKAEAVASNADGAE